MGFVQDYFRKKENDKYKKILVDRIHEIKNYIKIYENKSDDELKEEFQKLKTDSRDLDSKLEEVYAIVYLVIQRTHGMTAYDVQLQGGITLFDGKIAEMKTGEGKTITSVFPVVLRAMSGNGVHVISVNEYLTERDYNNLKPIYEFLGLTVALNKHDDNRTVKIKSYEADIMYSTASTLGFDYLNDNLVMDKSQKVGKRKKYFALIDEIDLVLIDEARTPLIIGRSQSNESPNIIRAQYAVEKLKSEDVIVDIKSQSVVLTKEGESKIGEYFGIENIYDEQHTEIFHLVYQALLANFVFKEDVDYSVTLEKGSKTITIIDTFTGRLYFGRRYNNGLHQALEAKHHKDGVLLQDENQSTATITLQNFFKLYDYLAGMSGTAKEEYTEFLEIYGLHVIEIDTNKPLIREDKPLELYQTLEEKWDRVVELTSEYNKEGHPVLIGTVSVEDSEYLSNKFKKAKIKHQLLNAKQDSREAEIISKAGKKGSVTISTNMSGRGTDILVDENYKLIVISTELNESTRIDNQLKGRTSRQGAPGVTETILSAEDSIFVKTKITDKLKLLVTVSQGRSKQVDKLLKNVQSELEAASFSARRYSLKYDDIIRDQRSNFYSARDKVLEIGNLGTGIEYLNKLSRNDYTNIIKSASGSDTQKIKMLQDLLLLALDGAWIQHINNLEILKSGIGWRASSGHNPIIVYQNEAKLLYDEFQDTIRESLVDAMTDFEKHNKGVA